MRMRIATTMLITLCIGLICTLVTLRSTKTSTSSDDEIRENSDAELARRLAKEFQDQNIVDFKKWSVGEKDLWCVIREIGKDSHCEGVSCEKLIVSDGTSKLLYEDYFNSVQILSTPLAIRGRESPYEGDQLALRVNYGGQDSFFTLLAYKDRKIVELLDKASSNATQFNASIEIRPQFRTGISPAMESYQVLATGGVSGFWNGADKYTSVLRFQNGKYRYVGQFQQRRVDDYLERLITQHKTGKR